MSASKFRVSAKFKPETLFEVSIPSVPFRGEMEHRLERLKEKLLSSLLQSNPPESLREPLRRAASEAATLAWLTPYPILVFPLLLEEKAADARLRAERQASVHERSRVLLAKAA